MATFTVTTTADSGAGSLRNAIATAQSGDTIQFSDSLSNQTIGLSQGPLVLAKSLTLDGAAAPGLTISGENTHQVLQVQGSGTVVTVANVAIANGFTTDKGGGISTDMDTDLTVQNVRFENNVAHQGGGAISSGYRTRATVINSDFYNNDGSIGKSEHGGGAILIWSESELIIHDSTFEGNTGHNGGAINNLLSSLTVENSSFINNDSTSGASGAGTSGYGGAIYTDGASDRNDPDSGTILIRNSLFEGNRGAGQGGALFLFAYPPDQVIVENTTIRNNRVIADGTGSALGGGLRHGNSTLILRNSTLEGNLALSQGGGLWIGEDSPATITNTTFSANRADDGAGNGLGGAIMIAGNAGATTIRHSTFAYNQAGFIGGAFFAGSQSITLTNTLVVDNTAGNPWNINQHTNRQLDDGGGNLQFPAPQTTDPQDVTVTDGITIADPQLQPLSDYMGSPPFHALLASSPAVDRGVAIAAITTDQRGFQRDARPDIGAYEWSLAQPTEPPISPTLPISDGIMRGTDGHEVMRGDTDDNRILGDGGDDRLLGGKGNDRLVGGTGRDRLSGGDDNDLLLGGTGRDRLTGQNGNDLLKGGNSRDILNGGSGNDRLIGGLGHDVIVSGKGRDRIGMAKTHGFDRVKDFQDGIDKIDLMGIGFNQLTFAQVGNDVLIKLDHTKLLRLEDMSVGRCDRADFI